MFIYLSILTGLIRNTISQLIGQLYQYRDPEPVLPIQNPPDRTTPVPPPPPLYLDWARHADDGNVVYFLRPAHPDHTPVDLWPGEIAGTAQQWSLPAERYPIRGCQWYPSTRDEFWWARKNWELCHSRKWIMDMNPFDQWDAAWKRSKPCRAWNHTM